MKLVYVRSQRGPVAEKWPDDIPTNNTNIAGKVLVAIKLKRGEDQLPIAELQKRYPYKEAS